MKKLIINERLKQFLKKERCLTAFIANVKNNTKLFEVLLEDYPSPADDIAKGTSMCIDRAFAWDHSITPKHAKLSKRESFNFWSRLHSKWLRNYKEQ